MTHVLVIDDSKPNIDVLGMLLSNEGATYSEVLHPANVEDAVNGEGPFDVVFLDLEFPTNNGFTIVEKLRRMEALKGVPIVAYSVHTSEFEMARRAGFDGFLGKPLDADQFPDQLQRILNGEQLWSV